MTLLANPFMFPKLLFIPNKKKNMNKNKTKQKTLVQNLCDSYKLYILESPAAIVWESQWAAGFLNIWVCSSISSLKKNDRRDLETYWCLSFRSNMSMSLFQLVWLTTVTACIFFMHPFVQLPSVSQSVSKSVDLISDFVAGECSVERESVISRQIVRTRVTREQIISWIWAQLIAAVDNPDSLLPPGFHLLSHQAQNCGKSRKNKCLIVFDKLLEN